MKDAEMPKRRTVRASDDLQEFFSELLADRDRNMVPRAMEFVKRIRRLEGLYASAQDASERKSDQLRRLSGSKRRGRRRGYKSRNIEPRHLDDGHA